MTRILKWNGTDVPDELRDLPAGRYILDSVDDAPPLTPAIEDGLRAAMRSIDEGGGVSLDDARRRLHERSGR